MKKLLLTFAVLAVLAPAALADSYQASVTKNAPLVETFQDAGWIQAWWGFESAPFVHLNVDGPGDADCSATVAASEAYIDCSIPNAPTGTYTATVSVDSGKLHQVTLIT